MSQNKFVFSFYIFLVWTIFKVFTEFVAILFLFCFVFGPEAVDLSSLQD